MANPSCSVVIARRDLRIFYNKTNKAWRIEVVAPFDKELVEKTFDVDEVDTRVPTYMLFDKMNNRPYISAFGTVEVKSKVGGSGGSVAEISTI
jgi:hypothetical protein